MLPDQWVNDEVAGLLDFAPEHYESDTNEQYNSNCFDQIVLHVTPPQYFELGGRVALDERALHAP